MTVIPRIPGTTEVSTKRLRAYDVLTEIVSDVDRPYGYTRDVVITYPPHSVVINYAGRRVMALMIVGESHTNEGEPYTVKRVATTDQKWSIRRP